jgi:hypothetical protein
MYYFAHYEKDQNYFASDCNNSKDGSVEAKIWNKGTHSWEQKCFSAFEEFKAFTDQLCMADEGSLSRGKIQYHL